MNNCTFSRWTGGLVLAMICMLLLATGCASNASKVVLADGQTIDNWKALQDSRPNTWQTASAIALDAKEDNRKFVITPGQGVMVNGPDGRTTDILSTFEHGDCEAHIEFMVTKGSNSGVYFVGQYEIQILDSFGKEDVTPSDCGAIYSRWIENTDVEGHAPAVNAAKPAGEWQTFDVIFRTAKFDESGKKIANAKFVKVIHNGQLVHENVELNGVTRGAMGGNLAEEKTQGPMRLQGDHGPVAYRNIWIRPLD